MVGQPQRIPGKMWVPPNQAQMAGQVINAEVGALSQQFMKADKSGKLTPQDARTQALQTLYPASKTAIDWQQKSEQLELQNRAISKLMGTHTSKKDGTTDKMGAALTMFTMQDPTTGMYVWAPVQPETKATWMGAGPDKTTYAGMSKEEAVEQEAMARNALRIALQDENKKATPQQIEAMLPPSQFGGAQGVTPPPGGAQGVTPPPSGAQGAKKYSVSLPGQGTQIREMTDEQKALAERAGAKVVPSEIYAPSMIP
jgi:hypothetical protein